jgi:prepilin-type N-terminal cleavage/methylation domain-containing protein
MRNNIQKRSGFTLIEMLIVMAIMALLLTIALPRYFGSLENSREVALQENLKVLRLSLDRFYADKGRYPQTLEELVEQKYLRAVPVDPITESASTWVLIPSRNEGEEEKDIGDVKSGASGTTRDGRSYGEF